MMDSLYSLLDPLVMPLEWLLVTIHETLGITWAWSIVVLTVIVRIAMLPLTVKQQQSFRAMQALQPEIKKLQQKYKGDRQRLNEEMMAFYKENKVNPFGSCLP
ncbi:MAG: YidC/Oxa1 family membrane protein insertase, partial [Actinomycetota bacterium]